MAQDTFKTLNEFTPSPGRTGKYHSLAALGAAGVGKISRLPRSIRVVLEALVRHCDGARVTEDHVRRLAAWEPKGARTTEIPFVVVRIVLQDLIGFGALNDLSAMRAAAGRLGMAPGSIEPLVPVLSWAWGCRSCDSKVWGAARAVNCAAPHGPAPSR